jgi:hypothetical protein
VGRRGRPRDEDRPDPRPRGDRGRPAPGDHRGPDPDRLGLAAARPARRLNVDRGRLALAAVHVLLASLVAIVAIIGLFGTRQGAAGFVAIGFQLSLFIVLPLSGCVAFGLAEWQVGRGSTILRVADTAAFTLGLLALSLGAVGVGRWLAGAIAILAASGIAASVVVSPPRRPGWRR